MRVDCGCSTHRLFAATLSPSIMARSLLRAALVALLGLGAARTAEAQVGLSLGLMGGAALPRGDFGDAFDTGWHAQAALGLRFPLVPVGLRVEGTYASFPSNVDGLSDATVLGLGATGVYDLPVPLVTPYLLGGVGYYRAELEDTENKFGWNAGAGVRLRLPGLTPFIEARYYSIDLPGSARMEYLPVTIGLTF